MITNQHIITLLKKYNYKWPPQDAEKGVRLSHLIIVSLGRGELHDSGFPYIQVLGADDNGNLYDLGEHDVIRIRNYVGMDIDSLGANIFRIFPDKSLALTADPHYIGSTIEVDDEYRIW